MRKTYEGFETWYNELLMTVKMHVAILVMLFVAHLAATTLAALLLIDMRALWATLQWLYAHALWPSWKLTFANPNGTSVETTAGYVASLPSLTQFSLAVLYKIKLLFLCCSVVYLAHFLILRKYKARAVSQSSRKYVRGANISNAGEFAASAKRKREVLDLPFGAVKMPVGVENEHTFIVGRPSTGKTNLLCQIVERLKERKERAIIYDFKSDYFTKFYDPREDLLFNPLDARSLGWNVFNEIKTFMDVDAITGSLVPNSTAAGDPFWNDAARDVLAGIIHYLFKTGRKENRYLWDMVTADGLSIRDCLRQIPEGQRGFRYIEDAGSKQALSVFAVMMQYAKCFEFMGGNNGDFTLQQWLDSGKGMIFITNYPGVQDTLRPVLSLFIDLLSRRLLSMADSRSRKIFFLLDEFGTLQRLSSIIRLLTLSRSKGGAVFIAIQDYGQIDRIYTKDHRQSIVNACGNGVTFALADPVSADISSAKLGETEYLDTETTRTMGVESYRDGTSLSQRKKRERLFLPADIMDLQKLTAVVKFSTHDPVVSKFPYKEYPNLAESFLMRPDLLLPVAEDDSEELREALSNG
jgi:type IV secretory pathway TraG/TraD family ATPase VirD4